MSFASEVHIGVQSVVILYGPLLPCGLLENSGIDLHSRGLLKSDLASVEVSTHRERED
jgi:hypothetical protein